MSRITESQRMLIRSEVRHMLNRSLLREAAELSFNTIASGDITDIVLYRGTKVDERADYYAAEPDRKLLFYIEKNKVEPRIQYKNAEDKAWTELLNTNDNYHHIYDAMVVADKLSGGNFNAEGYDKSGYDKSGYDINSFDVNGYTADGYDKSGYDMNGFNLYGYTATDYDASGDLRPGAKSILTNNSSYDPKVKMDPPAKRKREPQAIVKQIQTALGMSDVDGIWGGATNTAWKQFLIKTGNKEKFTPNDAPFITALSKDWATNSSKITYVGQHKITEPFRGTPSSILRFITIISKSSGDLGIQDSPTATPPTAEIVDRGYDELIAHANAQAQEALSKEDSVLYDKWIAHADTARNRQSQDTIVKSVAAANAKLDKELAFLKDIDPKDTFEFSDSALAADDEEEDVDVDVDVDEDGIADSEDDDIDLNESRWLRLAGLLKG